MLSLDAPDFPFGLLFILPESSIRNMTFGLTLPLPPLVMAWLSSTNGVSAILAPAYRGKSAKAKRVCLVKGLMLFDIFRFAIILFVSVKDDETKVSHYGSEGG